jgi:hypothetical protein
MHRKRHPIYATWNNIVNRTDRPRMHTPERHYAGLDMDPAWRDLWTFVAWAEANGWQSGLSIERNDIHRGYWPDNCRFIPKGHQLRNTRRTRMSVALVRIVRARIAAGERKKTVAKEISKETGIPLPTLINVAFGRSWKDVI